MEKSRTTEVSEVEANAVRDVALTTYNGETIASPSRFLLIV